MTHRRLRLPSLESCVSASSQLPSLSAVPTNSHSTALSTEHSVDESESHRSPVQRLSNPAAKGDTKRYTRELALNRCEATSRWLVTPITAMCIPSSAHTCACVALCTRAIGQVFMP
jgi:hypothetical protein